MKALDFDRAVRFLVERGAARPEHNSSISLLEHVLGTYRLAQTWEFDVDVQAAALFHSVYSTQNFPVALATYDEREAICAVIGDRAERLAFLFCIKDAQSLFALAEDVVTRRARRSDVEADLLLRDWRGGDEHLVTEREVAIAVNLVALNAVEQVARDTATLRRDAASLRRIASLLVPHAREALLRDVATVPA